MLSHFYASGAAVFDRFVANDEHGGIMKLWNATRAWRPEFERAKQE
jgi:hypothetical protein